MPAAALEAAKLGHAAGAAAAAAKGLPVSARGLRAVQPVHPGTLAVCLTTPCPATVHCHAVVSHYTTAAPAAKPRRAAAAPAAAKPHPAAAAVPRAGAPSHHHQYHHHPLAAAVTVAASEAHPAAIAAAGWPARQPRDTPTAAPHRSPASAASNLTATARQGPVQLPAAAAAQSLLVLLVLWPPAGSCCAARGLRCPAPAHATIAPGITVSKRVRPHRAGVCCAVLSSPVLSCPVLTCRSFSFRWGTTLRLISASLNTAATSPAPTFCSLQHRAAAGPFA